MKDFKKLIEEVVANSQLTEIPDELQSAKIFTWDIDVSHIGGWWNFTNGKSVAHTTWDKNHYDVMIDVTNLQYGSSANTFWGMLTYNEQITIYTSNYVDLTGKMVSIGTDIEQKYYALSYELSGFDTGSNKRKKSFLGKIVLVNIQKFLDNQFNEENQAPIINIANGRLGETIEVPSFSEVKARQVADPNKKSISIKKITIPKMRSVELYFPKPLVLIGGFDFVATFDSKLERNYHSSKALTNIKSASTKPKNFPINNNYSILPTQFNIPSIDNYGFTHPNDKSNAIKTILATQSLGSSAQTGVSIAKSIGLLGSISSGIASTSIGLAQKYFGDKGTLANSSAINPNFLSNEGDSLKFFIQGDGANSKSHLDENGYMDLDGLQKQNDYLEVNQANGEFGKYGKSMSPSKNGKFNDTIHYTGLGLNSNNQLKIKKIPFLATPYTGNGYEKLKIDDGKIDLYLRTGAIRQNINNGSELKPMVFPNSWDVYIRNMFFRPDPYSFWNWGCLMPSEIGVWDVVKKTDIAYDIANIVDSFTKIFGTLNTSSTITPKQNSFWNKTINISQITENTSWDSNITYSSFRYEFNENEPENLNYLENFYSIQFMGITSSLIHVKILDENDKVIRSHMFNSKGITSGTSASWCNIITI